MTSPPDVAYPLRPYSPVSRMSEVETRIREYIAENGLASGDRLPGETWFSEQLGVGRPLIREAMRGLEAVGVIEVRRGVGRFVGSFDPEAYLSQYTTQMLLYRYTERELIETRCLLEIAMAADAVGNLTDEDLVEISRLWDCIQAAAAQGENSTDADLALHRVIMSRSENRLIVAMLDAVHALAVSKMAEKVHSPERIIEDLGQHEMIVQAALARDGGAVRSALVAHFETTATRLGFEQRWRDIFSSPVPIP